MLHVLRRVDKRHLVMVSVRVRFRVSGELTSVTWLGLGLGLGLWLGSGLVDERHRRAARQGHRGRPVTEDRVGRGPGRSDATKLGALEAASSSTRDGGWTPSGWASPWECRAAQSRRAHREEAQEPS